MDTNEIVSLIKTITPKGLSIVNTLCEGIIAVHLLKHQTVATEIEKIRAEKYGEIASALLDSGEISYVEYYKANNFRKIAKLADQHYSAINHNNNNDIIDFDFDWLLRFYDAVSCVSDEDMQTLWAKILAGEINKKASFSLRTIETLKNMSKSEAELFQDVYFHTLNSSNNIFIPNYDDYLEHVGIQYDDIIKLSELGLINDNALLTLNIEVDDNAKVICISDELVMFVKSHDNNKSIMSVKQYPLTQVGRELSKILSKKINEEDYLFFGKILNQNNNIEIHRIISENEGNISYEDEDLLKSSALEHCQNI